MTPYNLDIIGQMYRARERVPYHKESTRRNLYSISKELAIGCRRLVAGIANVNGNHWVGIVVDVVSLMVAYGDPFGVPCEVPQIIEALNWWLCYHMPLSTFKYVPLPITPQSDTSSCSVLSLDAIRHAVLPDSPLLKAGSVIAINQARLNMFMKVARFDAQCVHRCLFAPQLMSNLLMLVKRLFWRLTAYFN